MYVYVFVSDGWLERKEDCKVQRGVGLPNCFYAMKVVDREALAIRRKLQRAEMEKEILAGLDHPFLPTLRSLMLRITRVWKRRVL